MNNAGSPGGASTTTKSPEEGPKNSEAQAVEDTNKFIKSMTVEISKSNLPPVEIFDGDSLGLGGSNSSFNQPAAFQVSTSNGQNSTIPGGQPTENLSTAQFGTKQATTAENDSASISDALFSKNPQK